MKNLFTIVLLLALIPMLMAQTVDTRIDHGFINKQIDINNQNNAIKKSNNKYSVGDYGATPALNWKSGFGGSAADNINSVVYDNSGNVYITGDFYDEISVAGNTYNSTGDREAFVAKFSNTGSFIWLTQIPSSANQNTYCNDISIGVNGDVYVTGYYTGTLTVGTSTLPNNNNFSMFYAKLNTLGQLQNGGYHSQSLNEIGLYIDTDANGNIYVSCTESTSTNSRHDSWFVKFNSSNTQVYANHYYVGFNDFKIVGNSIYYSGVIMQGHDGTLDANVTIPQPALYNDVFITKSDLNGVFVWGLLAGHIGSGGDSMNDRISYSDNSLFVAGSFRSSISFGSESYTVSDGNFLTKIDTLGNALWLRIQNPGNVAFDADGLGNTYVLSADSMNIYTSNGMAMPAMFTVDNDVMDISVGNSNYSIAVVGNKNGLNKIIQYSSAFTKDWETQFGGTSAAAYQIGMVTDTLGNVYSYNYTSGIIDYFGHTVNAGIFVCKQNGMGSVLWLKQFNNVLVDYNAGSYIEIDPSNQNIYFTGFFTDSLHIQNQPSLVPAADGSVFILKYDVNGNFEWSKKEDFEGWGLCLAADYSGNIILSGVFTNTISLSGNMLVSAGDKDGFIVKYNNLGTIEWANRAGGSSIEYSAFVSTDNSDNIYLAGEFVSDDVTIGTTSFPMLAGDGNVFLAKFNSSGVLQWSQAYGGSGHVWYDDVTWPTGIKTDKNGNSYIKGNLSYKGVFGTVTLENQASYFNKFITKVDNSGTVQWAKMISQPQSRHQYDYNQFDIDKDGSVYFGIQAKDTLDFGTDFQYVPSSDGDLFVAKYSISGSLIWVKTIIGEDYNYNWISSVAVYNNSNVFVGGFFSNSISIDGEVLSNINNKHGFITMFGTDINNGVKEVYNSKTSNIELFPNPASDRISFITKMNFSNASISVYSISGKLIKTDIVDNYSSVDVSELSKGVYFIKIYTKEGQIFTKKFIKE